MNLLARVFTFFLWGKRGAGKDKTTGHSYLGARCSTTTQGLAKAWIFVGIALVLAAGCTSREMPHAVIETNKGDIVVMLYNSTPLHQENFLQLIDQGFYDSLLFHRVIEDFIIQGGDPKSKKASMDQRLGGGGPGYLIDAEIGAPHLRGALAAARTGGALNPEKKSSGSQFYIVQGRPQNDAALNRVQRQKGLQYNTEQRQFYKEIGGVPQLDGDYTVFGEVVEGMEVVDEIAALPTNAANRPQEDVRIETIRRLRWWE